MKLYIKLMNHIDLGIHGEVLAENFLRKKGYQIISRNFRFKKWEVDIIAQHKNTIIFIEVKTRQTSAFGEPWKAVSRTKQKQIIQVANYYLVKNEIQNESRFDIVSIIHNEHYTEIDHLPEAFYPLV